MQRSDRYPVVLLLVFIAIWAALAVAPLYREDWLLENLLVFVLLAWLVLAYRRVRFSNAAYTCIFVFVVLHSIGAHYTYSEVPYDRWLTGLTGHSLNAWLGTTRNHYDRFIHLLYGLLIAVPIRELLRRTSPRGVWTLLLPWTFVLANSVIYELVEWLAALIFGGPLGQAYLGTQGDVWDSQKELALAALGAATSLSLLNLWHERWRLQAARSRRI